MPLPDGPPASTPNANAGQAITYADNRKAVMVIYGHDTEAKDALFDWLRAIGLQPREWGQLVTDSGAASPYIGQVLDQAFKEAQAVVALFTPDERVRPRGHSGPWRLQARPNVLIEVGMALASQPTRTVLVLLGPQDLPSDLAGRHYVRLSHTSAAPLNDLANRLRLAGCEPDLSGSDWLRPRRFPDRDHISQEPAPGDEGTTRPSPVPAAAAPAATPAQPGHRAATRRPFRQIHALSHADTPVWGVAFSPDGALLATVGNDNLVRLWRPDTGGLAATLSGHTKPVRAVAFSPDGGLLATGSYDETARLWDMPSGHASGVRTGSGAAVFAVAFSPDGILLATGSDDHTARIWDLATRLPAGVLTGHKETVYGVTFRAGGALLATGSQDHTARIWDLATRQTVRNLTGHQEAVFGVAFSPDGAKLATASGDNTARIWDPATGQSAATLTGHEAAVRAVAFSADGALLATASDDHTARIWDLSTGTCEDTLIGHTSRVLAVAFSPDGTRLATASNDKTARLWG